MNETNFQFNLNQVNPWSNLSVGAKVATLLAGLAIAAASIAASIFLAGAALFAALVFAAYQWIGGKFGRRTVEGEPVKADYTEVTAKPAEN